MRIATWNVNSLRARIERVKEWIETNAPEVLCIQETKCDEDSFPREVFASLGYETAHHGNSRWNGVAIASRVGLSEVQSGFVDAQGVKTEECRLIAARCGEVKVASVYVPNGRVVDSEHYVAKLDWLAHLRRELDSAYEPGDKVALCGDFNIAPEDRDVWDIEQFVGATHVTARERAALQELLSFGLFDALRAVIPEGDGPFSWWDYRQGAFHRGWGMRIDHVLVTAALRDRLRDVYVDRGARRGQGTERQPSDHAPVVVDLDT